MVFTSTQYKICNFIKISKYCINLVGVSKATHTTHYTENVVVKVEYPEEGIFNYFDWNATVLLAIWNVVSFVSICSRVW